ncbi:hypothetical protein [Cyclobacterium jeungdonense]|uniref:Lipoprotein n=1 Tax=Cyclobacterium jeungdonense TaxID=708087 RepID=A0ABT8C376_9BACT|nr:hypothetical protein [Cyclobacterium jeungdonense]MDN3686487.1 hypothetical protein [Cyclobacterium jeungdonense]
MKTLFNSTSSFRNSFIAVLLIFSFAACSTKITFPVSRVVPAAEPEAKVSKTKEGTYDISLNVSNLALPERLSPPKKFYMVWIDTPDQGIKKLGEIANNSGIFRNRGKAAFEASTLYRPNMILVTAENSLEVAYPGSHVVLKSRRFEIK